MDWEFILITAPCRLGESFGCSTWSGRGFCVLVGILETSCPLLKAMEVTPSVSDEKDPRIYVEARGVTVREK